MAGPKDLGPYNHMWPKRSVITLCTLEILNSLGILAWVLFSLIYTQTSFAKYSTTYYREAWRSGTAWLIVNSIIAFVLVLSIAFDVTAIALFAKKRLRPALYLIFQCIRLFMLVTMTVVLWTVAATFMTMTAVLITVSLSLAITQLVYGAVVVHRYREGFYERKEDLSSDSERDLEEAKDMPCDSTDHILSMPESETKRNRGAYNSIRAKQFVVTFWTLDFMAYFSVGFCSMWLGIEFFNHVPKAGGPTATITLSICAASCVTSAGLDIANVVSFCRSTLKPTTYLLYQCIKAIMFFVVILISAVSSFAASDAILGIPLAASPFLLSIGQLIYGVVALHREKKGFYSLEKSESQETLAENGAPQLHRVCVACGLHRPVSGYAYRGDDATILTPAYSSRYGESMTLRSGPMWSIGSDAAPPYSWKGSATGPPSVMSSSLLEAPSTRSSGPDWDTMSVDIAVAGVTEGFRPEDETRKS